MKQIKIIICVFFAFVASSCSENFLDKTPYGLGSFWNTEEDAELGINAAYEPLYFEESYGRGHFWLSTAGDDFIVNKNKTAVINMTSFTTNVNVAGYSQSYWSDFYKIIRRSNDVLKNVPGIEMNEQLKNRILGEANFLLGFAYFQLIQKYGGVPFYDYEEEDNINKPRLSREESYTRVENYLKVAVDLLSEWQYSGEEVGRPHKGSALGLLAKVYAFQGKWTECKSASDKLINSQQYELLPNYQDVFSIAYEKSSEHLFSLQCKAVRHESTITSIVHLPGSITNGSGWNYFAPTTSLAKAYEEGDMRKDATLVSIDGGEFTFDGSTIELSKDIVGSWGTDYICVKFAHPYREKYVGWESGLDIPILRYSDVLLLNAEATIMLNNGGPENRDLGVSEAAESFNKVRVRAFNGDEQKAISAPSFNDLVKERRCELAFEECRHYDLVRWGLAEEIYNAGVDDPRGPRSYNPSIHNVFPLPQGELDNSNGVLEQNPGY